MNRMVDAEVVERYRRGDATIEIIWALGVSRQTIYTILRRNGVEPNRHNRQKK